MIEIKRTRIAQDIIAEFVIPARPSKKVLIFCDGMPTVPARKNSLKFFAKKGFWTFHPRYRGSWESGGQFIRRSPHFDILDLISQLPRGFTSLWDDKKYKVKPEQVLLFGTSFGGPAAILASRDPRVTKAVLIAPVTDWEAVNKAHPRDAKYAFIKKAYGEAYRVSRKDWEKLKKGNFYNPVKYIKQIDGRKLLIFHAKDDDIVPYASVKKFAELVDCQLIALNKGGHISSKLILNNKKYYKIITKFLRSKL